MSLLLAFAVVLFIGVLISDFANKTIVSTSVLFLGAGLLLGSGWLPGIHIPQFQSLKVVAELALFSVLFSDGIRTGGLGKIREHWHLAGRALLIGMPLTIAAIAVLAHLLSGMRWPVAFLFGSVLSPTDPVFVAAIFFVKEVPERIKHALNLESGLNDGLALTAVLILLNITSKQGKTLPEVAVELLLGVAIGIAICWAGIKIEESRWFHAAGVFEPLLAFALGLLTLAVCMATGANEFLAAYSGGVTIATTSQRASRSFHPFGEIVSELLKLLALLIFGAVMAPHLFTPLNWTAYLLIPLAVFAVRPPAVALSVIGTGLSWKEKVTFGWFGPKGFASVIYGLLVYDAGLRTEAHLIGLSVILSIVVFSSTDLLVGRWFQQDAASAPEETREAA